MIGKVNHGRYRGEGRVDKQTGGPGQKAFCVLEVEALNRGAGFEFVNCVQGGAIPREFIPSIERGVKAAMNNGVLAGFPVVDIRVSVVDGSSHPVDSSEYAFVEAGRLALRDACRNAPMIILEPLGVMEVATPSDHIGSVIGDLHRRRGQLMGQEMLGDGISVIRARVPLAEMFGYTTDLRSMTQGRASFSMTMDGYEEVPNAVRERLMGHAA